ncbi:transglutaminase-like domain-containing protein [Crossiella cryophila]|uniref:Transglutaminase-like putative cysteine protease n=1 Tax=Crossiella cryophila TaxID=43355 RepID=A0A7W7CJ91_9PSEU|nr:transglutaminase family protein [Crossiella cryophila]MBB4682240.1 transglutaminase-like putative cysteine protease [Crossiella cryophila]
MTGFVAEAELADYLGDDEVVDFRNPVVGAVVRELWARHGEGYARAAFEWVRDAVTHSMDAGDRRVTWRASDVVSQGTGLCYAKSHLLVGLLRAKGIPAGLCYQRLADGGGGFVLHGLVGVWVAEEGRWARVDPRGDKPGVLTEYSLGEERIAFAVDAAVGEVDYPTVYASGHPAVVDVLKRSSDCVVLCAGGLPGEL